MLSVLYLHIHSRRSIFSLNPFEKIWLICRSNNLSPFEFCLFTIHSSFLSSFSILYSHERQKKTGASSGHLFVYTFQVNPFKSISWLAENRWTRSYSKFCHYQYIQQSVRTECNSICLFLSRSAFMGYKMLINCN